jgi:hypothetical protein
MRRFSGLRRSDDQWSADKPNAPRECHLLGRASVPRPGRTRRRHSLGARLGPPGQDCQTWRAFAALAPSPAGQESSGVLRENSVTPRVVREKAVTPCDRDTLPPVICCCP